MKGRGLTFGIVLLALGIWFLLRQSLEFTGPGPILLLIGGILFAISATRDFRGPFFGACILLGLAAGFLMANPLSAWLADGSAILLGLGCGFLLVVVIDAAMKRRRGFGPLVAGLILVGIAISSALARLLDLSGVRALVEQFWPWLLIAAGLALVVSSVARPSARSRGASLLPRLPRETTRAANGGSVESPGPLQPGKVEDFRDGG
jgi:hypothetical protein